MIRHWLLVLLLLDACGDDAQISDANVPGSEGLLLTQVTFPPLGDVTLVNESFNHPMIATDGTRIHAVGSRIQTSPYHILSWFDALTPTHALAFDATNSADTMTPTMLVPDGNGGVYVAGMLPVPQLSSYDPGVIHFDANGAPVWSKRYSAAAPHWLLIPPTGSSSGVAISAPVNGKLAVAGGSGILAIDDTGAVLWARSYPSQMQMHQLLADATGFTAYAVYYNDIYQFRFDWAGTLVTTQRSMNAFSQGIYAPRLYSPFVDAAGRTLIPYGVINTNGTDPSSGVMALDASGALVENFAYKVTGENDPHGTRNVLHDNAQTRILSNGAVEVALLYADTSTPPPYVYHRPRFVLGVDGSGAPTQARTQNEGPFVAVGNNLASIYDSAIATGKLGATCSYLYYEITSIAKVAGGQPVPAFAAAGDTPVTLTVTALDVPITTVEGGAPTAVPGQPQCKP